MNRRIAEVQDNAADHIAYITDLIRIFQEALERELTIASPDGSKAPKYIDTYFKALAQGSIDDPGALLQLHTDISLLTETLRDYIRVGFP